ncbi:MAG: hypothetical protein KDA05_10800 [Phycisphaerales bacterium]|nr:hypothetical protein [Phycisphaerales bacterium]
MSPASVLVLAGGPDRERQVSLWSAAGVTRALREGGLTVHERTIDRVTPAELASMPGDVIFPVLHGSYGEGGPLQDVLEASARPYVGCRPTGARLAMDKVATKLAAARAGVPTAPAAVLNPADDRCPLAFEHSLGRGVVLKPIHDGSSVGVHLVRTPGQWAGALAAVRADIEQNLGGAYMVESLVCPVSGGAASGAAGGGATRPRELTVGVIDTPAGRLALPVIQISPATEFYDYDAKYLRDDTRYDIVPTTDPVVPILQDRGLRVAAAVGVRHLCRVDFIDPLGPPEAAQLLELNTMPGFTSHSLLPMAAGHAGIPMPSLCRMLFEMALAEAGGVSPVADSAHGPLSGTGAPRGAGV